MTNKSGDMTTRFDEAIDNDEILEIQGEEVSARDVDFDNDWIFKQLLNAGMFDDV